MSMLKAVGHFRDRVVDVLRRRVLYRGLMLMGLTQAARSTREDMTYRFRIDPVVPDGYHGHCVDCKEPVSIPGASYCNSCYHKDHEYLRSIFR